MSKSKDSNFFTITDLSAFSNRNLLKRKFPIWHHTITTRVADRKRTLIWQLCRIHQISQFLFVHWRSQDHVRNTAHKCNIIGTVMRWAISTYQSGSIQTEYHIQLL